MREKTITQYVEDAHKHAVEFESALKKAKVLFDKTPKTGQVADALEKQRNQIWRDIVNHPDVDMDTVSGEPNWYLSINIDNLTLEKVIFGKNGVKVFANKEASDE